MKFPYTLYSCPCKENPTSPVQFDRAPKTSEVDDDEEEDVHTFNPHSHRADHTLYPLANLLFCNECHEIRCPRCYYEETLYCYCPNCLFDVSSNIVKTETNRCTRSCFQCPICIAPLAVQSLATSSAERDPTIETLSSRDGACMLACLYCNWASLDAGLQFEKPINISGQLTKMLNTPPQQSDPQTPIPRERTTFSPSDPYLSSKTLPTDQYTQLAAFYKQQISETTTAGPLGLDFSSSLGLDSPSSLSRLLSTYGVGSLKKQRGKLPLMREALSIDEGLRYDDPSADDEAIARMAEAGFDGMTSIEQQEAQSLQQLSGSDARSLRFPNELLPIQTQLRSKRGKRCRTCRHNLVKPDEKRHRNKFSIRLLALNYVPTTMLKPLHTSTNTATPMVLTKLQAGKTVQFTLTLRNPLYDPVSITLATPAQTAGKVASRVTILCPQFEVGADKDVWDEALAAAAPFTASSGTRGMEGQIPEAGKVWQKGRNWTSVVVEVVPRIVPPSISNTDGDEEEDAVDQQTTNDDVLEIPIFVRVEYETDEAPAGSLLKDEAREKSTVAGKVKREIAYWCVVGAGRIATT